MKKSQDSKMDPGYELSNEGLLLDLEQIRKLQKINPNVVSWIMARAEEEQQARHNLDISKLALEEAEQSRLFKIDALTIISAFILMLVGMLLSYLLLTAGLTTTGGIFAGGIIIFASIAFLNFRRPVVQK